MKKNNIKIVYFVISFFALAFNAYYVFDSYYAEKELNQSKTEFLIQKEEELRKIEERFGDRQ